MKLLVHCLSQGKGSVNGACWLRFFRERILYGLYGQDGEEKGEIHP